MLSAAIRTTVAALQRPFHWNSILCLWCLHLLSFCSLLSSLPLSRSATFPIFSFFPSIIYNPSPSLMLPNTQSSSPFHPLPISCFVCKPQRREMGEKHSLCTTVTKDRWVIAIYVPVSLLPQKTHTYTGKTLKLPLTCCSFTGRHTPAHTHTHRHAHSKALKNNCVIKTKSHFVIIIAENGTSLTSAAYVFSFIQPGENVCH